MIALGQINTIVGDFKGNTDKIIMQASSAAQYGAHLIVFPELTITGYPLLDTLHYTGIEHQVSIQEARIEELANELEIAIVYGSLTKNTSFGKKWYNSAVICLPNSSPDRYHKQLLPTYDVFDESRHFEPGNQPFFIFLWEGKKYAVSICEDIWCEKSELYGKQPVAESKQNSDYDFLLNLSASPFHIEHHDNRRKMLSEASEIADCPVVYVNQVGANTDLIFDGHSGVYYKDKYFTQMKGFSAGIGYFEGLESKENTHFPVEENPIALIHQCLILGIQDFFKKIGFKKAVLGLSGGIDSAVVCALAVEALGAEHVYGILLPSEFSSDHSITDAEELCKNLGIEYHIHPIKQINQAFLEQFPEEFHDAGFNVAEENLQSRIRGTILMGWSNKFGHVLLNTTNKSEMAVGYGTLYGDMNGALSVLGDVYKTEVYDLARYINRHFEFIPVNSIIKAPSAELRPDQKDTDSLPDYLILDAILYSLIEEKKLPEEIISLGKYQKEVVENTWRLLQNSEFKRFQAAPVIRVHKLAFGDGRRMPLVFK